MIVPCFSRATVWNNEGMKPIILFCLFISIEAVLGIVPRERYNGIDVGFQESLNDGQLYEVTLSDRTNCAEGDPQPPNRHDTVQRVNNLVDGMNGRGYSAYIVPSSDEHQNEYVAESDERREYISGFTGSAGTAVVLVNGSRALWTDGRYFLQADEELDCNWLLMKEGLEGVPSIADWLISSLNEGDTVSADGRLVGADTWIAFQNTLQANGLNVVVDAVNDGNDLLDEQWNEDGRPAIIRNDIFVHEIQFAGKSWQDKVSDVVEQMNIYGADVFVITGLDEIAWLFNVRGSDIPYNPVFSSYAIIDNSDNEIYLFIDGNLTAEASQQLHVGSYGVVAKCVSILSTNDLESFIGELNSRAEISTIMIPGAFSYSLGSSFYIYNLISNKKRISRTSPVLLMKASKNEVEQEGMRNAHVKDAAALISFLAFLDKEIAAGNRWTELEAVAALEPYRLKQEDNMGLSFDTISAFGANAAIIHYSPTPETDTVITDENVYLLDSGGQYKDGTTDVTRTLHFGTPTAEQIEAYTRVLMGVIDFASSITPRGTAKSYIDVLARRALYQVGLDYRHGTSHGIGMFLYVHEASDATFEIGFCGSDEPGYYQDGEFGIRIENTVMIVEADTKYNFTAESYGFETLTLVPYEPKLIDFGLLNKDQCVFLDEINSKIRSLMSPVLLEQDADGYDYMLQKTNFSCTT